MDLNSEFCAVKYKIIKKNIKSRKALLSFKMFISKSKNTKDGLCKNQHEII